MRFGEQLVAIVKSRGLTMAAFGQRVGCSAATLSRLRTGRRSPQGLPLDQWADALGLDAEERHALHEAALVEQAPEPLRQRLHEHDQSPAELDGWWLAYHHSFKNDGSISRTLARLSGSGVRWIGMEQRELEYSYTGSIHRLGDQAVMQLAEDRGGRELVQITMHALYGHRRPAFLHGLVAGISGTSFRQPLSLPCAARMVMLHLGPQREVATQDGYLDQMEGLLGRWNTQTVRPLWPSAGGINSRLWQALDLQPGEDADAMLLSLIDNHLSPGDSVLRAGCAP
jgi:transcriptional regulator with XRE-family HTH domain